MAAARRKERVPSRTEAARSRDWLVDGARTRTVFEGAAIGFVICEPSGRFVEANPAFCALTGYTQTELRAMRFPELVHPDDVAFDVAQVERMRSGEIPSFQSESRYRRKDGAIVWVRKSVSVVREGDWTFALVEDISRRKSAEAELAVARVRESYLLDLDADLRPLRGSEAILAAAARRLGTHLAADRCVYAEMMNEDYARLRAVWGDSPVHAPMKVRIRGEVVFDLLWRGEDVILDDVMKDPRVSPNGRDSLRELGIGAVMATSLLKEERWVGALIVHSATPRVWTALERTLLRETAERTWAAFERARAEEELRASERMLAEAERVGQIGSWEWDLKTDAMRWSRGTYALYDLDPERSTLSLSALRSFVHPDDRESVNHAIREIVATGTPAGFEFRVVAADGTTRVLLTKGAVVRFDPDGSPRVMTGVNLDVSDRKRAERELRQSEEHYRRLSQALDRRTRQLSHLTAELTLAEQRAREQLSKTLHDGLQQLLFAITLKLDRASKRAADDNGGARAAELIADARNDLDEAITAARSLSVELFPRALHDGGLVPAIEWLAGWMREKYGLLVQLELDARATVERRDVRVLVFESIRELLFNAVKHARVDRVRLVVSLGAEDSLHVEVFDRGAGFDPARLFERADLHHAGLGLLSIRERLALLGGRLEVQSAPGEGSRVRLITPRAPSLGEVLDV